MPTQVGVAVPSTCGEIGIVEIVEDTVEECPKEAAGKVEMEYAVVQHIGQRETTLVRVKVFVQSKGESEVAQVELGEVEAEIVMVYTPNRERSGVERAEAHGAVMVAVGKVHVAKSHVAPRHFSAYAYVVVEVGIQGQFESGEFLLVDAQV